MATNTTRLGLIKPDFVDVVDISELNSNADDIDAAVGAAVVTSTTRPSAPWTGQIIHETDTDKTLVWDGVAWVETGAVDLGDLGDVDITTPTAGEKLVFDGTNWVNLEGYVYVDTVYFTSDDTFTKATYPWLRAIRVKCQGAGGGGGGAATSGAGQVTNAAAGGGGGYSESFITDIAGLSSSVTVTVGAGGAGGAAGNNAGSAGGSSSFGTAVVANGGSGGIGGGAFAVPVAGNASSASDTAGAVGQLLLRGSGSEGTIFPTATIAVRKSGAPSPVFGKSRVDLLTFTGGNGETGENFGSGGGGGANAQNQATARSGGAGAAGIVIVELYA
jgi:hypothetical protein